VSIDWKSVRGEFEASCVTFVWLARRYGCKADTIRKRAARQGWKRPEIVGGDNRVGPACADTGANEVIGDHRTLWKGVKSRLVRGLHHEDAKSGLDELKIAKTASEVLSNVIKGERLAWGLEDAEEFEDQEEIASQMDEATSSASAAQAVDGE